MSREARFVENSPKETSPTLIVDNATPSSAVLYDQRLCKQTQFLVQNGYSGTQDFYVWISHSSTAPEAERVLISTTQLLINDKKLVLVTHGGGYLAIGTSVDIVTVYIKKV